MLGGIIWFNMVAVILFGLVRVVVLTNISKQLAGLRENVQQFHDEIHDDADHLREELFQLNDIKNKLEQIESNTRP